MSFFEAVYDFSKRELSLPLTTATTATTTTTTTTTTAIATTATATAATAIAVEDVYAIQNQQPTAADFTNLSSSRSFCRYLQPF